ncbi:MAG TPA: beta-galactosidase trimerization domain-containing protein, partial [Bryobacteraceae bacterium]|nr:beta-galactosidase trimerization domain-containing protein [Bryobacteraceae bacterium]
IQADFVPLGGAGDGSLADYKVAYLPYPLMLKQESAAKLKAWVEQGGTLISEGLPAYFGDHGRAGAKQPNYGLDQLFGARESYVEFTPDLLEKLTLEVQGHKIDGRYFLQEYELAGGSAAGKYTNGHIAAVEHRQGKGRTLLIGTFPGSGYYLHHSPEAKKFFAGLLDMAGVKPRLKTDNPDIQARLHTGTAGTYLWVTNPGHKETTVNVILTEAPAFQKAEDIWGARKIDVNGRALKVTVPARDAAVISLK